MKASGVLPGELRCWARGWPVQTFPEIFLWPVVPPPSPLWTALQTTGGRRTKTWDRLCGRETSPLWRSLIWFDFERKYCFLCANHLLVKKWMDVEQHIFNIHTLCSRWILVTMVVFWTFYFLLDWRSHVTFLLLLSVCFSKIIPCHLLCIKQMF